MRPQRRKRQRFGTRENEGPIRCQGHLQYVRGCVCSIAGKNRHVCWGKPEAHHVQSWRAIEGGMGMKVGDNRAVALCSSAHRAVHDDGQQEFEKRYGVNLESIAESTWKNSPHRIKYERAQQGKD